MSASFRCAAGCGQQVTGVYCDRHRAERMAQIATIPSVFPGEKVAFDWRGKERQGVIESVARVNAVVLIEVGSGSKTKQKLLEVRIDKLRRV